MVFMVPLDHNKKYMVIDGHLITISFSKAPNPDLFGRIKDILLSSGSLPQNRLNPIFNGKMRKQKEA